MSAKNWLPAVAVASLMSQERLQARAVVQDCLDRIGAREDAVRALEHVGRVGGLAAADRIDGARRASKPLAGVVVGVKDNIDTADMPTTCGSRIYRDHRPESDAACVARLRENDAVVLCKTVTAEFAGNDIVPTANPHDLACSPGGSSSGSAAAVADGMVHVALGTQTGGSVIRPAAYCGVVGYKPSFGLIDRRGVKLITESFDTVGVLARSVDDAALVVSALAGRSELRAPAEGDHAPRLTFLRCETPFWNEATAAAREPVETVTRLLAEKSGAEPDDLDLPAPFARANDIHKLVMSREARHWLASEYETGLELMGPRMRDLLKLGESWSPDEYKAALHDWEILRRQFDELVDDDTILITPSAPDIAPRDRTTTGSPIFNCLWSGLHAPALTIPAGKVRGLPVGVQLVAKPGRDAALLRGARMIEALLEARSGQTKSDGAEAAFA